MAECPPFVLQGSYLSHYSTYTSVPRCPKDLFTQVHLAPHQHSSWWRSSVRLLAEKPVVACNHADDAISEWSSHRVLSLYTVKIDSFRPDKQS